MSEPPDKPGPGSPSTPAEPPRATTTQPLAPVDPAELDAPVFETTGSFRTSPSGVPILDAPFPTASAPAARPAGAPASPASTAGGPPRPATPAGAPPRTVTPAAGATRPAGPGAGAGARPGGPTAPPPASATPVPGAAPARGGAGTPVPGAPAAGGRATPPPAPRTPTREQPAFPVPRTVSRPATPAAGPPAREAPRAHLGSPTGEFLTEQARAAGPAPQPGVVPAKVFRPTATPPANPPLPSLGVRIAPVIPPLAPASPSSPRAAPAPPGPRIPHRPTRDPMSETSLGIPVMPPLTPAETRPLPPLDVRIAPLVPPVAPVVSAPEPPADPEAQVAWKAERLDALDYFELLGVPTTASAGEVKRAFYRESRAYHPDRFFHLTDEAFKARVHEVYKRVTEAYYVLRDDVRRPKYLADVSGPERARKLRFDELAEQETKAQVKQQAAEQIGLNPKARQLYQAALADLERGNLAAAERGLKMALTYEPQNALYKEKLTLVQERLHEESRGKAFKIT